MEYMQLYPHHNAIQSEWGSEMDGQAQKEGKREKRAKKQTFRDT